MSSSDRFPLKLTGENKNILKQMEVFATTQRDNPKQRLFSMEGTCAIYVHPKPESGATGAGGVSAPVPSFSFVAYLGPRLIWIYFQPGLHWRFRLVACWQTVAGNPPNKPKPRIQPTHNSSCVGMSRGWLNQKEGIAPSTFTQLCPCCSLCNGSLSAGLGMTTM